MSQHGERLNDGLNGWSARQDDVENHGGEVHKNMTIRRRQTIDLRRIRKHTSKGSARFELVVRNSKQRCRQTQGRST